SFPATNISVSNFISTKLVSTNYPQWSEMAMGLAESQGLAGHLTGESPAPAQFITSTAEGSSVTSTNPSFTKWKTADRLLRSWLLSTISDEVWPLIAGCTTAEMVW
ncbi:hypothetical protein M569_00705, partial [Genlisea aurea]